MKICVNARFLNKPFTGIGQYTINLFKELASISPEHKYVMISTEKVGDDISKKFPKNVEFKILPEKKVGTAGIKKTWWEQISVPEFIEKEKPDIAFFPYPSNPWTKDWYKKGIKTFVAVHDCIPWTMKNYRKRFSSKMYHHQTKKSCSLADAVFTVSETSKKDIEKVCRVDSGKIFVIYNDAGNEYKKSFDESFVNEVLADFNLEKGQYFVYAGGYDDRKNVEYLVSEYEKFAVSGDGNENFPLVLVGGKVLNDKLGRNNGILKTGFLDSRDLAVLYGNSTSFVHFSKQEGFNIPLLEAANCGAPLILSDIEIHREIAKDSAIFVDIKSEGNGEAAFSKILDKDIRKKFAKKSLDLAAEYSWKKSAQKMKDVIFS